MFSRNRWQKARFLHLFFCLHNVQFCEREQRATFNNVVPTSFLISSVIPVLLVFVSTERLNRSAKFSTMFPNGLFSCSRGLVHWCLSIAIFLPEHCETNKCFDRVLVWQFKVLSHSVYACHVLLNAISCTIRFGSEVRKFPYSDDCI